MRPTEHVELRDVTGSPPGPDVPLAVSVKRTCSLIGCGATRVYELIRSGELESFLNGRSRRIVFASILRYIARRVAESKVESARPAP